MARTSPLLFLLVSGCIIYANPGWYRDKGDDDTDVVEDTDLTGDSSAPVQPAPSDVDVRFHPSGAALGQTVIASLVDHSDPPMDLSTTTDVDLLGPADVRVVAVQVRDADEVLVTLRIPSGGTAAPHDALVTFADGSALMLQDAFEVVEDPADAPTDVWTGEDTDVEEPAEDTDAEEPTEDTDVEEPTEDTDVEAPPDTNVPVDTDPSDTDLPADTDQPVDTDLPEDTGAETDSP